VPGGEHIGYPRQPSAQGTRHHQLMGGHPQRHVVGRGDLGGHRIPVVQAPLFTLGRPVGRQPGLQHIGDREQPLRTRGVLHPRPRPHRTSTTSAGGSSHKLIEHTSEITHACRLGTAQMLPLNPNLWMNSGLWISCSA